MPPFLYLKNQNTVISDFSKQEWSKISSIGMRTLKKERFTRNGEIKKGLLLRQSIGYSFFSRKNEYHEVVIQKLNDLIT